MVNIFLTFTFFLFSSFIFGMHADMENNALWIAHFHNNNILMYTIFQICKILISCTNNDQIPYFCLALYIRCMKVKLIVHTRIHCITSSQVKCFFICLCSPSVYGENKQIENTSTWENAVSIMQTLKIGEFFFIKNWI